MLNAMKPVIAVLIITILLAVGFVCGFTVLYPYKYIDIIVEYADKYNLPPELVCAVIHTESRFRPNALSHKDAAGLMQLTRETADWGASVLKLSDYSFDNIHEPRTNIELGCWYLNTLFKQFDQKQKTALAAYNAGSGNVERWLSDEELSRDSVNLDSIPFGETKRYVEKVARAMPIYRVMLCVFGGLK